MFFNIVGGSGGVFSLPNFSPQKWSPTPIFFLSGIHRTQDHARVAVVFCCRVFFWNFSMHALISQNRRVPAPPPGAARSIKAVRLLTHCTREAEFAAGATGVYVHKPIPKG